MDSFANLAKSKRLPSRRDPHLHSAAHVLADDLSAKLNDRGHFGLYLKLATTMPHDILRRICGEVLEANEVKNRGKLFAYLIKKHNQSLKDEKAKHDTANS